MRFATEPVTDNHAQTHAELSVELRMFIQRMYGDMNPADLQEYLRLVCENLLPVLGALECALDVRDYQATATQCHKLRNMTSAVGAKMLSKSLSELEVRSKRGEGPDDTSVTAGIRLGCESVLSILRQIRNAKGSAPFGFN
jgi:HPt (histidine-containing phosphotransfer) domain-containing protein